MLRAASFDELALDLDLAGVHRQIDERREVGRARHVAEEIVDRFRADDAQHRAAVGVGERQITHLEALHVSRGTRLRS